MESTTSSDSACLLCGGAGLAPPPVLGEGTERSLSPWMSTGVAGTESSPSPVEEEIMKLSAGVRGASRKKEEFEGPTTPGVPASPSSAADDAEDISSSPPPSSSSSPSSCRLGNGAAVASELLLAPLSPPPVLNTGSPDGPGSGSSAGRWYIVLLAPGPLFKPLGPGIGESG